MKKKFMIFLIALSTTPAFGRDVSDRWFSPESYNRPPITQPTTNATPTDGIISSRTDHQLDAVDVILRIWAGISLTVLVGLMIAQINFSESEPKKVERKTRKVLRRAYT